MTTDVSGWNRATLPALAGDGGLFVDGDWIESKDQDQNGEVRLIQLADIGDGLFVNRSNRFLTINAAQRLRCTFLEEGDLLIARMPDPLGRACIFPGVGQPAVTAVDVCIFRPATDVSRRWIMFAINSPAFRAAVAGLQSGSTRKRISRRNLGTLELPIPPRRQQDAIVSEIEKQFTRLDAANASLLSADRRLERYRDAVLTGAMRGTLPLMAFDSAEAPSEIEPEPWSTNGERAATERRHFDFGPAWSIPGSWRWCAASELCERIESGSTPAADLMSASGEIPFIKVYNLTKHGWLDFSVKPTFVSRATHNNRLARSRLRPGDVLTNIVGPPLGKVAVVPHTHAEWNMNQAVVMFRPLSPQIGAFLQIALMAPNVIARLVRTSKATAGQYNVSLSACRSLPIPFPPPDQRTRIVEAVGRYLSVYDACKHQIKSDLTRSGRLRSCILGSAFTGVLAGTREGAV